jgi:hypothetical protein
MKKIPKNNPFKTPEGYFEGLTDGILDRLRDEPGKEFPAREGFVVPDGYFEKAQHEIIAKTTASETAVIPLYPYKKFLYMAASVAAIAVIVIGLQWNRTEELTFEDLASSDITSYFDTNQVGLSSYELAEALPVGTLDLDTFMDTSVDKEHIMDYLEDSIDDLDELNIDLDEAYQ